MATKKKIIGGVDAATIVIDKAFIDATITAMGGTKVKGNALPKLRNPRLSGLQPEDILIFPSKAEWALGESTNSAGVKSVYIVCGIIRKGRLMKGRAYAGYFLRSEHSFEDFDEMLTCKGSAVESVMYATSFDDFKTELAEKYVRVDSVEELSIFEVPQTYWDKYRNKEVGAPTRKDYVESKEKFYTLNFIDPEEK